jgi:hypothetical protein
VQLIRIILDFRFVILNLWAMEACPLFDELDLNRRRVCSNAVPLIDGREFRASALDSHRAMDRKFVRDHRLLHLRGRVPLDSNAKYLPDSTGIEQCNARRRKHYSRLSLFPMLASKVRAHRQSYLQIQPECLLGQVLMLCYLYSSLNESDSSDFQLAQTPISNRRGGGYRRCR